MREVITISKAVDVVNHHSYRSWWVARLQIAALQLRRLVLSAGDRATAIQQKLETLRSLVNARLWLWRLTTESLWRKVALHRYCRAMTVLEAERTQQLVLNCKSNLEPCPDSQAWGVPKLFTQLWYLPCVGFTISIVSADLRNDLYHPWRILNVKQTHKTGDEIWVYQGRNIRH